MTDDILCGSLCVKYILDYFNVKHYLNKKMIWASELSSFLNKCLDREVFLYYHNSNLVSDFFKLSNKNTEGIKQLDKYIKNNGILIDKRINRKTLKEEVHNNTFVILCVDSKKFNNDSSMDGGHFILLKDVDGKNVNIINPQKNSFAFQNVRISKLISCSKKYGSWRIAVK